MHIVDEVGIACCCGCGTGWGATAPIQPLAWELPYAAGAALKSKKHLPKKQKRENMNKLSNGKEETDLPCRSILNNFFFFLRPHLQHMEFPRLGAESEL